ncbi:phenylacetate--CoA ligase family protein [Sphingobacterium faecium]|uniref:phenylacetate--CoA ligase family protein n=1 Tax=Sphingobacterium faecium TaxID=34087 RepID=UPI001D17AE67|nr:hypothetical protein [Sphingobacterium faecium]
MMKENIYKKLPDVLQCILIGIFNILAYRKRYGGNYRTYLNIYKRNRNLSLKELKEIQANKFSEFLFKSIKNSKYFKNYPQVDLENISLLPIMTKEDFRKNIDLIYTIDKSIGILSKTGGTTGKSLEVLYTEDNLQDRFACLDDFRNRFDYELGKKTAWFSGKNILTDKDKRSNRYWKTDPFHKVRYYSTFHIKDNNLKYYLEDLIKFKPEYLVGFPSTMLEIAKYGKSNGYEFPTNCIKAIFPTAETITPFMRDILESFFNTKLYNQYASSEGAPFIFECHQGNLHLELQSGVFEVLDDNNNPTKEGNLVVTSFTTLGTPLIRYNIGDSISLEDEDLVCSCGNSNPLVKEILGRIDDFVYSPENGKINLGNVSNTLKDTHGIKQFQVVQDELDKLTILLVVDKKDYNEGIEEKFVKNWKDRIGENMILEIKYVELIPVEISGKFRIVKNNIKHLID